MEHKTIEPRELARFAAEGVAIALKAREPRFRGPAHIYCGIPPEIFEVTIVGEAGATQVSVGEVQRVAVE